MLSGRRDDPSAARVIRNESLELETVVGKTPELAKSLGVREALTELSHAWRSECGPHSRKVALETQRMGAGTHPLLAIAVLQILEVVVLPLRPQSHTQQREPALLGHGREVVSEASE